MNNPVMPEADLHAYVDERLDAVRRSKVEAWLAIHPLDMERINAYRSQNEMLHTLFDPVLDEALTLQMESPRKSYTPLWRYAAMAGGMVMSGILGWSLHGANTDTPMLAMARQAAIAHVVYTPEVLHPVEVGADREAHLVKWLSKRLGTEIKPPHLHEAGFELVGGRLLPGNSGPSAQFMYQDARGQRLTLYLSHKPADKDESAFRYAQEGKVGVFYWIDGTLSYALSGEIEKPALLNVANAVYHSLNP